MLVKFCIASGAARISPTCGMDETNALDENPVRLAAMGRPQYKTYSPELLQSRINVAEKMSDDTSNIWRNRIICSLAPIESVFCINFIPTDPTLAQILLVMRMKSLDETAESYPIFCQDLPPYKFMLPKERVDQVFDVSKQTIPQTIEQFNPVLRPIFEKTLGYLTKEKKLKGIALTLKNQDGALSTYIWVKG